ncbi:FHA domain-containing protein [Roseiflexus sp.]
MPPHLAGVRGPLIGRTFALGDQPLTIGRAADNAVVIASPRASRHHAHIRREGAAFVIYDLGSANGTLVNGQRVQRAVLQPGDLIDIGDEVFRFEAGHQQDATLLSAPQAQPPAYPSQPPTAPAYPPQAQPPAYPPQPQAQPQMRPPAPPYPPQSTAPSYPQQTPAQGYPGYGPPAGHPSMYAPPPPRTKSSGRSCLLVIIILLALVCVAGVAGAFVFRDRLRDIPGVSDLPGIGGNPSGIAPPPVHTGSATVGSGQAAAISMPNGPMIEVPHGAVPPNPDGTPGTLTFSVAPAPDQPVSLPDEMALSGSLYQFEPEGVTFAVPVRITLPIPAGTDPARVMGLVTRDAQSGEWVTIAGAVDAAARTVSAEVTHFSPYGVYSYTGSDPGAWQRKNGGWFVLEHPGVRGDSPYPMCRQQPRSLYLNVCIQSATLADPGLAYLLPPDNLLAIGQRYGSDRPFDPLKVWLPAGTYRVVHYIFMSEINNDPLYVPCRGWWVKPPQVINLQAGQTITFERFAPEDGVYMDSFDPGTCTGTPASPPGVTQPPHQPPADTGLCPAKMNGEWNARLTLRSTNDPDSQDEIGDVEEAIFAFQINGREALVQLVDPGGERSDFARGTCSVQNGRYVIDLSQTDANAAMVFTLQFSGDDRMSGDIKVSEGEKYLIADAELTRRAGSGQSPSGDQPSTFTDSCPAMTGNWDMTMNLVSSTNPDVPTGGTRQGVLNLRVENETVYAQWTEGGRQSQTAGGTCTAQGDKRYQIVLREQMPELHPLQVQPPPSDPNQAPQVPLEELLFPITFDVQFENQNRMSGNLTVLAYNHKYASSIVMSRR